MQSQINELMVQLDQVESLHLDRESVNSATFIRWNEATKRRISKTFGEDSDHYSNFDSISYIPWVGVMDDYRQQLIDRESYLDGLSSARTLLMVMLDDLQERFESGDSLISPSHKLQTHSIDYLVNVIRRFRECCQYLRNPPDSESSVQDLLWIILRSHYDDLVKEQSLPKFGVKGYRPDFGIASLRLLIEVKFIGEKTEPSRIQEEILGDVQGYLNDSTSYDSIVVFIYDAKHKLRDSRKFVKDLVSVHGISEAIVVPGM